MEAPDGSPPQSLCLIRAAELFPKSQMEKEDTQLTVPYKELDGESVKYLGRTDDGILALSNYRLFLLKTTTNSETSVPLRLIEVAQTRDLFHLLVYCKDASTVKCSFETAEQCSEWARRIQLAIGVPETLESLFAFPFCSWTCETRSNGHFQSLQNGQNNGYYYDNTRLINTMLNANCDGIERLQRASLIDEDFMKEVERLGFDLNGPWRISTVNQDFKLCPSYPQKLLVPCCIADDTLQTVANFRASRRLPAVVWRHRRTGAVIARCSQPEVGWLGWRNYKDEQLLKALADACAFDRGEQLRKLMPQSTSLANSEMFPSTPNIPSGENSPNSLDGSHEEVALDEVRKVLIVDARSYTSAVTNRARGGGCECIEYYPCAEIEFMNLGNIHVIRKSFNALRALCASPGDVPNWLGTLERSNWLQHLSGLLAASMTVCHAIEKKGRPVLVHCSDGWDRTPQIVATAELCLDPYYRTVEGFRILVEREWLSFGHKFADRCGHGPNSDEVNERCPVFLQWLDLVHQIHKQFPCAFEFNMAYLIKIAQHSLSCLFGTFLCNTLKERIENSVFERTFSIWPFLSDPMYLNPLYIPQKEQVLWPAYNVRDLALWTEVYLGSLGNQNSTDIPSSVTDGTNGIGNPMIKTRSYGDLNCSSLSQYGLSRRSSDPNMSVDPNLTPATNSENNSVADIQSEREDSPDLIANTAYDTSRKLQDLTTELNNEDEDFLQPIKNIILKSDESEALKTNDINSKGGGDKDDYILKELLYDLRAPDELSDMQYPAHLNTETNELSEQVQQEIISCDQRESNTKSDLKYSTNFLAENHKTSTNEIPDRAETKPNDLKLSNSTDLQLNNCNSLILTTTKNDQNNKSNNDFVKQNNEALLTSLQSSADSKDDTSLNGHNGLGNEAAGEQNLWHNSVNTSTDTLVPIDNKQTPHQSTSSSNIHQQSLGPGPVKSVDNTDGSVTSAKRMDTTANHSQIYDKNSAEQPYPHIQSTLHSTNSDHLPKVHNIRPNSLVQEMKNFHQMNDNNQAKETRPFYEPPVDLTLNIKKGIMDESIMILPTHPKLEISLNGKCETVSNNNSANTYNATNAGNAMQTPPNSATPTPLLNGIGISAQRRHRTFSSNSRREIIYGQKGQNNASSTSRFSLPGNYSLPLTPPGSSERQQLALSCPDGLTHALSEQNIRLQQIVYEHKLREEILRRELHDMRIALLKKQCPSCSNPAVPNDEQSSVIDNMENLSICSWEAVDDRSGPSSCTSSSTMPNNASVLWVPDHAVSRCTSCQMAFWIGRRKHHCRSCGQIFCADCSEFWAPLPLEKLLTPVRLCGPCYHTETTRMQMSQYQSNSMLQHHFQQQSSATKANASVALATQPTPAAASSKA